VGVTDGLAVLVGVGGVLSAGENMDARGQLQATVTTAAIIPVARAARGLFLKECAPRLRTNVSRSCVVLACRVRS